MVCVHFTPKQFHPISFHPILFHPALISPHVHVTPHSFQPTFISPHVHFTTNSFNLLISPHTRKIPMGGWYHSIRHWMQYLENITPQPGNFALIHFFCCFFKNNIKFSYFLKIFRNYFVYFSTQKKDTDGGLVPFDSSLNAVPEKENPQTWEFCFDTFFAVFSKITWNFPIFWKLLKIILFISPHTRKIPMGGWYHSICHSMQYLENMTRPTWEFCFNTFFCRFFKNNIKFSYFLKIFRNYFVYFSTHKKDTDRGLVPFDSSLNAVPEK